MLWIGVQSSGYTAHIPIFYNINLMRTITLNGQTQSLIPIRTFRAQHNLSQSFGVSLFEPKDYTGLAALDQAGAELQRLRGGVLAAVPVVPSRMDLLSVVDRLQEVFETELRAINPRIGLREPEIEFAVAGFGDMCRLWAYALIRGRGTAPDFASVYSEWLNDSVRVSTQEHVYAYGDQTWQVRILNAIYGRMGLEVTMPAETVYIADSVYACPAEGFMATLLQEVGERLAGRP
jgi:hypothetical protein